MLPVSETVLRVYCTGLCTGLLSYVSRKEVCGIDSLPTSVEFLRPVLETYVVTSCTVLVTYPYGYRVYPYYCTTYLCAKTPEEPVRTLRTEVRTDS